MIGSLLEGRKIYRNNKDSKDENSLHSSPQSSEINKSMKNAKN